MLIWNLLKGRLIEGKMNGNLKEEGIILIMKNEGKKNGCMKMIS